MSTTTHLYIIPGYEEHESDYLWLIDEIHHKYEIAFLDVLKNSTSFKKVFDTPVHPESVVFGFSIGALIAYKLTTPVKKGIYCSPSNILGKDAQKMKRHIVALFGKTVANELTHMEYGIPATKEFVVLCGEHELDTTTSTLPNLKVVPDTGHEFTPAYKSAVLREL